MLSLLRCPYCQSKLKLEYLSGTFGVTACLCDKYPIIENIIFLKKDDSLTNKILINLIKKKSYFSALILALYPSQRTYRYSIFLYYVLHRYFKLTLSQERLLSILMLIGRRSKSWFAYLIQRRTKKDFQFASMLTKSADYSNNKILDIGFGIGHLYKLIKNISSDNISCYVGIDKNFMTLLIARLYNTDKKLVLLCADVDAGLPLKNKSINAAFLIDTFVWIHNKGSLLKEAKRVLTSKASLTLVNLFADASHSSEWGYGISPTQIRKLFSSNKFFPVFYNTVPQAEIHSLPWTKINPENYSVKATKK